MKTSAFSAVAGWLETPRVEGPITPADVEELVSAQLWDGDYAAAHALAGDMVEHAIQSKQSDTSFGRWLGIRPRAGAVELDLEPPPPLSLPTEVLGGRDRSGEATHCRTPSSRSRARGRASTNRRPAGRPNWTARRSSWLSAN